MSMSECKGFIVKQVQSNSAKKKKKKKKQLQSKSAKRNRVFREET